MYYKFYRRRQQISLLLVGIFIIFIYIRKSNDDEKRPSNGGVVKREKGERVNMQNYVQPPPCVDCPGENGAGVSLTVSF
jgi:hypothetical protein